MTSNVGVRELSSFGKNIGFETDAAIVNEQEKARSIIEKALKKKFGPQQGVLSKEKTRNKQKNTEELQ